ITVFDLMVGELRFDIRFWREQEETRFEVLKGDATKVLRRPMTALSDHLRSGTRERVSRPHLAPSPTPLPRKGGEGFIFSLSPT
ncbi:MAG: hypothetical protein ACREQ5_21445, partial [Candidatus Dormibacteria bacterium]